MPNKNDEDMVFLNEYQLTENITDMPSSQTMPSSNSPIIIVTDQQQQPQRPTTIVRDSDKKLHKITLDSKYLEITLLNHKSQPTPHTAKIALDFLLCITSNQVPLRCGIPKKCPANNNSDSIITEQQQRNCGCCSCFNKKSSPPNVLYIYYAYRWNVYTYRLREAALYFQSTAEKMQWSSLLNNAISELSHRPKQLMVFINPFGGKGKANNIWAKQVEPFFKLANISYEMIKTERADHAFEFMRDLDSARWQNLDGIVSVGGDGLFNEVLSAAVIRTQREHSKNYNNAEIDCLATPRLRFGIIGAGSANSIVSSVFGINDCPTSAICIALGSKCFLDICAVYEDGNLKRFSGDAISYGWLGDVLHDSERFRCLGPIRYQFSALRTSIRHPTYFGRVSFMPSEDHLHTNVHAEDTGNAPTNPLNTPACSGFCEICSGQSPPDERYPYHWQSDFTHVICCVIPCVSPFTPYGLAPYTGLNDGTMDLALIPAVSRFKNMQIMRKVAMYGAKFIRSEYPDVKVFRVSRWKFTPKAMITSSSGAELGREDESGAWNLDGEILPQPNDKSLHFRLHPSLISYFGPENGPDLDDPQYSRCCPSCHRFESRVSQLIIKTPSNASQNP